jgi:hypothetical protein
VEHQRQLPEHLNEDVRRYLDNEFTVRTKKTKQNIEAYHQHQQDNLEQLHSHVRRYWENEVRRAQKTKKNVEDYVEYQMTLVEALNLDVRNWLNAETRIRPKKFVQGIKDYYQHQVDQRERTEENVRHLPNGNKTSSGR